MTISISIEVPSKADFRAKVVTTDTYTATQTVSEYFIEPSEKRSFYATDTRSIQVSEVPLAGAVDAPPVGQEDPSSSVSKMLGLPVAGYRPQSEENTSLVNANKRIEEQVLRTLDGLAARPEIDKRWLATGRTDIEKGFMAVNRAVFQPGRVMLPEDAADGPCPGAQNTHSRGEPRP